MNKKEALDKVSILEKELTILKDIINRPENTIDQINDFSDILKLSNKTLDEIIPWRTPINKNQLSQNALAKIQLITEVLNEGEILNYTNKQTKYRPWFERKASS